MCLRLSIYLLLLISCFNSFVQASIYVFDVNNTTRLDLENTTGVIKGRWIAQNTFLQSKPGTSLDDYIKKNYRNMDKRRQAYRNIVKKADTFLAEGLINQQSRTQINALSQQYDKEQARIRNNENKGVFPSLIEFIEHIIKQEPRAAIVFQAFDKKEIKLVLQVLQRRFEERLTVEMDIATFDDQDRLHFQNNIHTDPRSVQDFIKPGHIIGLCNNYQAGGKKVLFFEDQPRKFLKTYFFDDNAHRLMQDNLFKVIYNHQVLTPEEGTLFAKPYIFSVNIAGALMDPNYFINLWQRQISAASFNIELSGLSRPPHSWPQRRQAVYALLRQYGLLMLQEVTYYQLIGLQEAMPGYHFIGVNSVTGESLTIQANDTTEGMVIGYNKDLYERSDQQPINRWFSDTPEKIGSKKWATWNTQFPKLLQRVVLKHKPTQLLMCVYNSHFSHEDHPDDSVNPQLEAAKIEIEMIKKDLAAGHLVISGGDRNTRPSKTINVLNAYQEVPDLVKLITDGRTATFIGFPGHPKGNPVVNGEFKNSVVLDYIFHSTNLERRHGIIRSGSYKLDGGLNDYHIKEESNPGRNFASDHALVGDFFTIKSKSNNH